MGVGYNPGPGGPPPVTQFQDPFTAPAANYLGPNWFMLATPGDGVIGSDIDSVINVGTAAGFGGGGGNFNAARVYLVPAFVSNVDVIAGALIRGQFSQMKLTAQVAGVDCSVGPSVFIDPLADNGYMLNIPSNVNFTQLRRGTSGAILKTPVFTYATNDVIRIECTFTPSQNTIKSYQNGILMDTTIDNNAARPLAGGLYGIAFGGSFTGLMSFNNYSGGLL